MLFYVFAARRMASELRNLADVIQKTRSTLKGVKFPSFLSSKTRPSILLVSAERIHNNVSRDVLRVECESCLGAKLKVIIQASKRWR